MHLSISVDILTRVIGEVTALSEEVDHVKILNPDPFLKRINLALEAAVTDYTDSFEFQIPLNALSCPHFLPLALFENCLFRLHPHISTVTLKNSQLEIPSFM